MMEMYPMQRFTGHDGQLIAHPCFVPSMNKDMIELWPIGEPSVVLTQEEFQRMVNWVNAQFEALAKQVHVVH